MKHELNYSRVHSLQELSALQTEDAYYLIGGDYNVNPPAGLKNLVDLQDLDLEAQAVPQGWRLVPAMVSIQKALQALEALPALAEAASLEGGRNLRNSLSLGNYLRHGDANGPLRVCLAALGVQTGFLNQEAASKWADTQAQSAAGKLPLYLLFPEGGALAFESIGRSPKDKPILCLAVYRSKNKELRVAISHPAAGVKVFEFGNSSLADYQALADALADSGDAWASAEYRQAVVQPLLERALKKLAAAVEEERP